ncbi:hypothetical protein V3C99_009882, partial [Haemonchus contortus]
SNGRIFLRTGPDTETMANPTDVAKFKCNCRYLWIREFHGVSALVMSNSLNEKIFWLFVIVICGASSIFFADSIMESFSENGFSTRITIIPVKQLKFPTLVFCPKYSDNVHLKPLLNDISSRIANITEEEFYDVMLYMIAGSGFDSVNVDKWSQEKRLELDELLTKWRGERTLLEMFDFVFNQNGYTCTEMFHSCFAASKALNCCEIFEPTYVMMRGRCHRLVDNYYQRDVDERDKMTMLFHRIHGNLLGNNTRPQLLTYISDSYPEIAVFPRIYLSLNDWNRMRLTQRKVSMFPGRSSCSTSPLNQGKSTCIVHNWINRRVVQPLNCTLPAFKTMLPYLANLPVCKPLTILGNYRNIVSTDFDNYGCLPACERVENHWGIMNTIDTSKSHDYGFRLEASFENLQYEDYTEIRLTTIPRFISELGGQSGLFVGCSVMTYVQFLLGIVLFIYNRLRKCYRNHLVVPLSLQQ